MIVAGRSIVGIAHADAVVVEDGRIATFGFREDLERSGARVDRYDGIVVPAMRDSHVHPGGIAASSNALSLAGIEDMVSLGEVLGDRARNLPDGVPVVAVGLDDEKLGHLPEREELDGIVPDRPVLVYRTCSHVAMANTPALELAGIGPETADPQGGAFDRRSGQPNGLLRETAVEIVARAVDVLVRPPGPAQVGDALDRILRRGTVRVDAIVSTGTAMWCGSGDELRTILALADRPAPKIDVFVATDDPAELEAAAEAIRLAGGSLAFGGWKGFADGSLGGRTAALSSPYTDAPGVRGTPRLVPERDLRLVETAHRLGGASAIHAIGDAAASAVLELYATVSTQGPMRMEHCSVLEPGSVRRMADLGVVASVQPGFVVSDAPWLEKRLGPSRAEWAYAFQALDDAGVQLRFGSDAPIEEPDPWLTTSAARTVLPPGPAFWSSVAGRLVAGAPADLVVIDRDPLTDPRVEDARVLAVYVDGRRMA